MKSLENMSRDERSLLLFLETCAVDNGGKVDTRHMNSEDLELAKTWGEEGFIEFGRIKMHDIKYNKTHWVILSDDAWELTHKERRNRCKRIMENEPLKQIG
jgi:hypothetical protein